MIPRDFQNLYDAKQNGENIEEAFQPIGRLLDATSIDVNPIPIKALTAVEGFGKYELRLPLVPLPEAERKGLEDAYQSYKAGDL